MFTTNDFQHWAIIHKSKFTIGIWYSTKVYNIRSSINPSSPGTNYIYFRDGIIRDPIIHLTNLNTDTLYMGSSSISYPDMRENLEFRGTGVWVRQAPTNEVGDTCLNPTIAGC